MPPGVAGLRRPLSAPPSAAGLGRWHDHCRGTTVVIPHYYDGTTTVVQTFPLRIRSLAGAGRHASSIRSPRTQGQ
jgi:hypothetical protein